MNTTSLRNDIISEIMNFKLEDILIFEMSEKYFAQVVIITSAASTKQLSAISSHILDALKGKGYFDISAIGPADGGWVLVDCGDVILHIFTHSVRTEYNIESLLELYSAQVDKLQN